MTTYRYHWTHRANLDSIAKSGLDPTHSRGKLRVVWMCESARILWAVGHVSRHHECQPDDMVLLRIRVDGLDLGRTSWPLVNVSSVRIAPSRICVLPGVGAGRAVSLKCHQRRAKRG